MTVLTTRTLRIWRQAGACCALCSLAALAALTLAPSSAAYADVVAAGDVQPAPDDPLEDPIIPIDGGDVDDDIIVGGTGVAVADDLPPIGILVIDDPAFTDPLTSNNAFIGDQADGVGEVTVSGFGSEWSVDSTFVTGVFGVGYLNITGGARVRSNIALSTTDADAIVGQEQGSQGFVTVSGFGSQWINTNLVVGDFGFGRVDVTARAQVITRDEAILGRELNLSGTSNNEMGTAHVVIDGRGTRWNIGDVSDTNPVVSTGDLTIGQEGRGILEVRNQGLVAVENDTLIGSLITSSGQSFGQAFVSGQDSMLWSLEQLFVGSNTSVAAGELYVSDRGVARSDESTVISPRGLVQLATGGVILSPSITNAGIIRGDGRLEGSVVNTGWIRNAGLTADLREKLWVTGSLQNIDGNIESIGGEMEFEGLVTNAGFNADLFGKDAIFRFNGGINNSGNVFLDNTVVWSPGTFVSDATFVLAASESVLVGDLELGSSNTLFVEIGRDFSRLELTQVASLDGALDISLADDYIPRLGDAFEIIQATGVTGTFASVIAPNVSGFDFGVTYTPTSAIINVLAGFVFNADFDGSGTVDAADLAIWRLNFGSGTMHNQGDADGDGDVDGEDFALWQQQLGTMPTVAAASTVPEPGTVVLLLSALALPLRRRTRQ